MTQELYSAFPVQHKGLEKWNSPWAAQRAAGADRESDGKTELTTKAPSHHLSVVFTAPSTHFSNVGCWQLLQYADVKAKNSAVALRIHEHPTCGCSHIRSEKRLNLRLRSLLILRPTGRALRIGSFGHQGIMELMPQWYQGTDLWTFLITWQRHLDPIVLKGLRL